MTELIFILTSDWQETDGRLFLRFFGTSSIGTVETVISNFLPYFFVSSDAITPEGVGPHKRESSILQSFAGVSVDKIYFQNFSNQLKAARIFERSEIQTFESDIKPTDRFLMDNKIYGCFAIPAPSNSRKLGDVTRFLNPDIVPANYSPEFKILSLDIETSRDGKVISIGLHSWSTQNLTESEEVLILGPIVGSPKESPLIYSFESEKELLSAFSDALATIDPDIIIGWNVIDFDLSFLFDRFQKYRLQTNWGRMASPVKFSSGSSLGKRIHLNGRVVIDGPSTLRLAFYRFENFKLETVAQTVLSRGKKISLIDNDSDYSQRASIDTESSEIRKSAQQRNWDEIERRYKEDSYALAEYNIEDCRLVSDIFKSCKLINLQATRSIISGLLMSKVGLSTAAFDHFLVPIAHQFGLVANNVRDTKITDHAAGGHVLEPKVGLYDHVIVLDFKSLYPSIIRTFKIDPISLFWNQTNGCKTPSGHCFSQSEIGLAPFIEMLLEKRSAAKIDSNENLSQAIKILMNSFYGVMGSGGSRFYHPDLPSAITGTGRWILKESEQILTNLGYNVIYGDTDSVFVLLKEEEQTFPLQAGDNLATRLNQHFKEKINSQYGLDSYLEIEFEKYYKSFFLPPSRSKEGGSKKRYAGLLVKPKGESLQFTGLEFVRSDWTALAKTFQFQLMGKVFQKEKPQTWIKQFIDKLRKGEMDQDLIYSKRLTKPAADYLKSRPPHVKAALLLSSDELASLGRKPTIRYLMTISGPEPIEFNPKNLDYSHYIEKQIKPIADSVLWIYQDSFDNIIQTTARGLFD